MSLNSVFQSTSLNIAHTKSESKEIIQKCAWYKEKNNNLLQKCLCFIIHPKPERITESKTALKTNYKVLFLAASTQQGTKMGCLYFS